MKPPSPQAIAAARLYLKFIDGSDFGDPEHGHDINQAALWIDRGSELPKLLAALKALQAPLRHVAKIIDGVDTLKPDQAPNWVLIPVGTELEAYLSIDELRKAVAAIKSVEALLRNGKAPRRHKRSRSPDPGTGETSPWPPTPTIVP